MCYRFVPEFHLENLLEIFSVLMANIDVLMACHDMMTYIINAMTKFGSIRQVCITSLIFYQ